MGVEPLTIMQTCETATRQSRKVASRSTDTFALRKKLEQYSRRPRLPRIVAQNWEEKKAKQHIKNTSLGRGDSSSHVH